MTVKNGEGVNGKRSEWGKELMGNGVDCGRNEWGRNEWEKE